MHRIDVLENVSAASNNSDLFLRVVHTIEIVSAHSRISASLSRSVSTIGRRTKDESFGCQGK